MSYYPETRGFISIKTPKESEFVWIYVKNIALKHSDENFIMKIKGFFD